jgi:hypothetical protein
MRLENFQCVQYSRSHTTERSKDKAVNVTERQPLWGFAPQHVELMSKDKDLGLQRSPRPERSDQGAPDQLAKIAHWERVSADSRRPVNRFGFAVGTTANRAGKEALRQLLDKLKVWPRKPKLSDYGVAAMSRRFPPRRKRRM